MREANVYCNQFFAGVLQETDDGAYTFTYDEAYLARKNATPISLTLPLQQETYRSKILFSFFDGLIPEGWLLDLAVKNWKLRPNDRMALLMTTCEECIGNVSIKGIEPNGI